MKKEKLFEYLGEIDDDMVIAAEGGPDKGSRRRVYAVAAAACVVLIAGAVIMIYNKSNERVTIDYMDSTSQSSTDSSQADIAIEVGEAQIYYIKDGKLLSATEELPFDPQEVFAAWKRYNGMGDEVKLIGVHISDNGTDTESGGVAAHTAGDKTVMTVTVSSELKSYLEKEGGELLEQSLQKTMTGYGDPNFTPDEYRLEYD